MRITEGFWNLVSGPAVPLISGSEMGALGMGIGLKAGRAPVNIVGWTKGTWNLCKDFRRYSPYVGSYVQPKYGSTIHNVDCSSFFEVGLGSFLWYCRLQARA